MRLLVVEDDEAISTPLVDGLTRESFDVRLASTAAEALAEPLDHVDVVLLDLGLPDVSGHTVCIEIRKRSNLPIIVVTARGAELDRVALLELGADDYVVKPFGMAELVARIRAVHRRATGALPMADSRPAPARLVIDQRRRSVTIDDEKVSLTPREFDLLVFLASDAGAVLTREVIMTEVWDENWWGSTKTLDVHIASIRKKLCPESIETIRGVGFRLAIDCALQ